MHRIFCIGQNYASHAKEMGAKAATPTDTPVFFTKPADSIAHDGDAVPYPPQTEALHHEIELVVALHHGGQALPAEKAADCIFGYAAGIDLTRRDLQQRAKAEGKPWDMAKGFDHATPCSAITPAKTLATPPARGKIQLSVNGEIRQDGNLAEMRWSVPQLISLLSRFITLKPGDLLMTGTPAGVGPVFQGDKIDGHIENIGDLSITIK